VEWLRKQNIDINSFIRGTVRVRIEEIKKASLIIYCKNKHDKPMTQA
jgi:hypothetical protein